MKCIKYFKWFFISLLTTSLFSCDSDEPNAPMGTICLTYNYNENDTIFIAGHGYDPLRDSHHYIYINQIDPQNEQKGPLPTVSCLGPLPEIKLPVGYKYEIRYAYYLRGRVANSGKGHNHGVVIEFSQRISVNVENPTKYVTLPMSTRSRNIVIEHEGVSQNCNFSTDRFLKGLTFDELNEYLGDKAMY